MSDLAVIVYLAAPRDRVTKTIPPSGTLRIDVLIKSISTVVQNFDFGLPIIIFHEDYIEKDRNLIKSIYPYLDITFEKVDFSLPSYIDENRLSDERQIGYRMMCRFFTGVLQNHPLLDNYEYYVRLDDDSFFIEPSAEDDGNLIERMKKNNCSYLFRSWYEEPCGFSKTKEIYEKYGGDIKSCTPSGFRGLPPLKNSSTKETQLLGLLKDGLLTRKLAIYNNFHISKVGWWRSEEIKNMCKKAEDWIMYDDVWDSTLHTLFVCLFMEENDICACVDFGYRHNIHISLENDLQIVHDRVSSILDI